MKSFGYQLGINPEFRQNALDWKDDLQTKIQVKSGDKIIWWSVLKTLTLNKYLYSIELKLFFLYSYWITEIIFNGQRKYIHNKKIYMANTVLNIAM